jgi:hypothetical protein
MKVKNTNKKRETPPKFHGRFTGDGGMSFGTYTRMDLKKFARENPDMPFELKPLLAESEDQRGFFEGGICPLVAFYQEGMDYRSYKDRKKVRDWLKIEFNGDLVALAGKTHRIAKSTKNKLNDGFLERVQEWFIDNYSPPKEVFDTSVFKNWRDKLRPLGESKAETYIDYLLEIGLITKPRAI